MVESSLKVFSLDRGSSDGSTISITFDVPPGMQRNDLNRALLEEKEKLDMLVLHMERLKGTISPDFFGTRADQIKAAYATIPKREDPAVKKDNERTDQAE